MDSNKKESPMNDESKQANKGKKGRWDTAVQWTDILSTVVSLVATIVAGLGANLFSDKFSLEIPTSFIVAFSITIGVAIILYFAFYVYRKQIREKKVAISEMQKVEQAFFKNVDTEISTLLSEKVN